MKNNTTECHVTLREVLEKNNLIESGQAIKSDGSKIYLEAIKHYENDNIDEAIKRLHDITLPHVDKAALMILQASWRYEQKEYNDALAILNVAHKANKHIVEIYTTRAKVNRELNKLLDALEDIHYVIDALPPHPSIYTQKADILVALGKYKEALVWYEKAEHIYGSAHTDETLQILKSYDIDLYGIHMKKVECHRTNQNTEAEWNEMEKAFKLNPNVKLINEMAHHMCLQKKYDKSLELLDKALQMDPNYVSTYMNRAYVHDKIGNTEEELQNCYSAAKIAPNRSDIPKKIGDIYYYKGWYVDAINAYTHAINLDKSNSEYYYARGTASMEANLRESAVVDLTQAIHLDPQLVDAYINRAAVYQTIGDYASIPQHYVVDPQSGDIIYTDKGAGALTKDEAYNKALADARKAIELAPESPDGYIHQVYILFKMTLYEEALAGVELACIYVDAQKMEHLKNNIISAINNSHQSPQHHGNNEQTECLGEQDTANTEME